MTTALTDEQVAGMDDTSDFMHAKPAFAFAPSGITFGRQPKPTKPFKGLQSIVRQGIPIAGRVQGEADMHRRDSIRRGGI